MLAGSRSLSLARLSFLGWLAWPLLALSLRTVQYKASVRVHAVRRKASGTEVWYGGSEWRTGTFPMLLSYTPILCSYAPKTGFYAPALCSYPMLLPNVVLGGASGGPTPTSNKRGKKGTDTDTGVLCPCDLPAGLLARVRYWHSVWCYVYATRYAVQGEVWGCAMWWGTERAYGATRCGVLRERMGLCDVWGTETAMGRAGKETPTGASAPGPRLSPTRSLRAASGCVCGAAGADTEVLAAGGGNQKGGKKAAAARYLLARTSLPRSQ
eukprot:3474020-Rhodomonas_salina.1